MSTQTQAMLLELLISGFFAIACFKARAALQPGKLALRPRDFLKLTDRVDRLSRTRYQWVAMVALLLLVRIQVGVPMTVELTAVAEFILFLALPTSKVERAVSADKKSQKRDSRSDTVVRSSGRTTAKTDRQECAALVSAQN